MLKELIWYLRTVKFEKLRLSTSSFYFRMGVRWTLLTQERPYFALVLRSGDDCLQLENRERMKKNTGILIDELRRLGAVPFFTTPVTAIELLGHSK